MPRSIKKGCIAHLPIYAARVGSRFFQMALAARRNTPQGNQHRAGVFLRRHIRDAQELMLATAQKSVEAMRAADYLTSQLHSLTVAGASHIRVALSMPRELTRRQL